MNPSNEPDELDDELEDDDELFFSSSSSALLSSSAFPSSSETPERIKYFPSNLLILTNNIP
jgi:hypothetical protein